jgi:hypothetical protein
MNVFRALVGLCDRLGDSKGKGVEAEKTLHPHPHQLPKELVIRLQCFRLQADDEYIRQLMEL